MEQSRLNSWMYLLFGIATPGESALSRTRELFVIYPPVLCGKFASRLLPTNPCRSTGSLVRKRESVDQEFLVLLSVGICPFLPGLLPGNLAASFTFVPFVFSNLFFDQVGDPVERIGIHDGRDRNVFFSL
jgi:hypothetical protein